MGNNPVMNFAAMILGGLIVFGISTHAVGDGAVATCDFVHKFQHNFFFELSIVLIIALLLWGLYSLWLIAMPVAIGLLVVGILAFAFLPDRLTKDDVHIDKPEAKEERVWGG